MKPESPDVNNSLAAWVKSGGTLLYIGDNSDPYHKVDGWWNSSKGTQTDKVRYQNPSEHLFEMMGLPLAPEDGVTAVGNGRVMVWNISPAKLCATPSLAEEYRIRVKEILKQGGSDWRYTNQLTLRRGPYIISTVMDEGNIEFQESSHTFQGLFADMLENDYTILTEKSIKVDENAILFDFSKIEDLDWRIVGCSARVYSLTAEEDGTGFAMEVKAADKIRAYLRIRLPKKVVAIEAEDNEGKAVTVDFNWDERTRTALFTYDSCNRTIFIKGLF
jgi:hypothetical protein